MIYKTIETKRSTSSYKPNNWNKRFWGISSGRKCIFSQPPWQPCQRNVSLQIHYDILLRINISVPRPDGITIMASGNDQPTSLVISNEEAIAAADLEDTVSLSQKEIIVNCYLV